MSLFTFVKQIPCKGVVAYFLLSSRYRIANSKEINYYKKGRYLVPAFKACEVNCKLVKPSNQDPRLYLRVGGSNMYQSKAHTTCYYSLELEKNKYIIALTRLVLKET